MTVPDSWRVPGVYIDVEPSLAGTGPGAFPLRALLIAPPAAGATVVLGEIVTITRPQQAFDYFGLNSVAGYMAAAWLEANPYTQLDATRSDIGGGSKASGYFILGGSISTPFVAAFYVGGVRIEALMETSPTVCGDNLVAACNEARDAGLIPFNASNTGGNVELEAIAEGTIYHSMDFRVNHLPGEAWGDPNLTVAAIDPVGGAGTPSITQALAAAAGTRYDVVIHPFVDATLLDQIQLDMEDRADALKGWPGMAIVGRHDTQANLATLGDGRNDRFLCIVGMESFPGWDVVRGAAVAGMAARYLQEDPVRPVSGRAYLSGYGPSDGDAFTPEERNLLLLDGISTLHYGDDARGIVERLITTYQETAGATPDETFSDLQTMFGLAYCRRSYVARFAARFPAHKLVPDGTLARPDAHIVSPELALDDAIGWYRGLVELGICTDAAGFARDSSARINPVDENRLEIFLAIRLARQLRVTDATILLRP